MIKCSLFATLFSYCDIDETKWAWRRNDQMSGRSKWAAIELDGDLEQKCHQNSWGDSVQYSQSSNEDGERDDDVDDDYDDDDPNEIYRSCSWTTIRQSGPRHTVSGLPLLLSWWPYSSDSYFHDLVFVFVIKYQSYKDEEWKKPLHGHWASCSALTEWPW